MPDCEFKDDVLKLLHSLVNILAIIKHFQIKIKEWLAVQSISTPSEEQILEVVRKNYDLTLKLQDSLDQYERYSEKPKHSGFFINMVREVLIDTRKSVYYSLKDNNNQQSATLSSSSSTVSVIGSGNTGNTGNSGNTNNLNVNQQQIEYNSTNTVTAYQMASILK